jgi:hypothetical protein
MFLHLLLGVCNLSFLLDYFNKEGQIVILISL